MSDIIRIKKTRFFFNYIVSFQYVTIHKGKCSCTLKRDWVFPAWEKCYRNGFLKLKIPVPQIEQHTTCMIFSDYLFELQRAKQLEAYQFLNGQYLIPIDGSQYFSFDKICCPGCLTKKTKGKIRYHHQILQAAIVHPDMKQVLPLAPESIQNSDGSKNKIVRSMPAKE